MKREEEKTWYDFAWFLILKKKICLRNKNSGRKFVLYPGVLKPEENRNIFVWKTTKKYSNKFVNILFLFLQILSFDPVSLLKI